MSDFAAAKVVGSLPATLTPNTLYCVRTGVGFDVYLSDNTGSVAHKVNAPAAAEYGAMAGTHNGLFRNGSGQTGDNQNWNGLTRNTQTFPFGAKASFTYTGGYRTWQSEDMMPIDIAQVYSLSLQSRYIKKTYSGSRFYAGLTQYDTAGRVIYSGYVLRYGGTASDTTLAQPLKTGDTKVWLTSAAGWNNVGGAYYHRGFWFGNYIDPVTGYVYERDVMPYTRWLTYRGNAGWWNAGAVNASENSITLAAPWSYANPTAADGTWPAGHPVSNSTSGGTYNYCLAANKYYGSVGATPWENSVAHMGGYFTNGAEDTSKFRPGCASARLLLLLNHGAPSSATDQIAVANAFIDRAAGLTRSMVGLSA